MTIERHIITSKSDWLERRKQDVTASIVGSLFSLHPYQSALRSYIEKQGLVELPAPQDNGPMRRGRLLERAVGDAVAEQRPNWSIIKANEYYRDPQLRLGATPDFFIHNDMRGTGVLQAKTAAPSVFAREWIDNRPPFWIVLQALTECMLTDAAFAAIGVLVVDPYDLPCHIIEVPRHAATEEKIRQAVAKFWLDVHAGCEPGPDYNLDRDLLGLLVPNETTGKSVDLAGDNRANAILMERAGLKDAIKTAQERCQAIEAELMDKMKDAERAIIPDWTITWKIEHVKGYEVKPRDSRVLRIRERKAK